MRRLMRARIIRRASVCLVLGACLQAVVTAALFLRWPPSSTRDFQFFQWHENGAYHHYIVCTTIVGTDIVYAGTSRYKYEGIRVQPLKEVPIWLRQFGTNKPEYYYKTHSLSTVGVPIRCYSGTLSWYRDAGFYDMHDMVQWAPPKFHPAENTLPIGIHWPAFVLQVLISGMLVAPVIFIPPVLWRKLRARRGLCVQCGYPWAPGSERCPECGLVRA